MISLFKDRGMIIEDEERAIEVLKRVSYYRFTGYDLTFKKNNIYIEGTTFETIYRHYEFDKSLRLMLMELIEYIEISIRTQLSYMIAHKYPDLGYRDSSNFLNAEKHERLLEILDQELSKSNELFVKHHRENRNGIFPVWVALEMATFSNLVELYSNLKTEDRVKANRLHAVHFSFPLEPAVQKLQGLLEEQAIGSIERMELFLEFPQWPRAWQQNPWISSRHQGGYLLEVGIHWIQMIQQVFGPITHVKSEIEFPPDAHQSESRAKAVLRLHNDIEVHLSGTDRREGEERVSLVVYGDEGILALENWDNLYRSSKETELQPVPVDGEDSMLPILKQIIQILNGEPGKIYDFYDGYNAQVVLEALRNPGEGFTDVRAQLLGDQSAEVII